MVERVLSGIGAICLLVLGIAFSFPSWRPHLLSLFGRSWAAMIRATGTTTLGFIIWTIAVTALCWLANVTARWVDLKKAKSDFPLQQALSESQRSGIYIALAIAMLVLGLFWFYVVLTVYDDHKNLTGRMQELLTGKTRAEAELEIRKHSISTSDPVFPNIIYLLQAFQIYRHARNGEPCVLLVSAPPEGAALASTVAQFSNSVSDCFTFGPFPADLDPDYRKEALEGMVPEAIVFHAARDDKAANELFVRLGNLIQLRRSYELPSTLRYKLPDAIAGKERVVWLQFGSKTRWNSDFRAQKP